MTNWTRTIHSKRFRKSLNLARFQNLANDFTFPILIGLFSNHFLTVFGRILKTCLIRGRHYLLVYHQGCGQSNQVDKYILADKQIVLCHLNSNSFQNSDNSIPVDMASNLIGLLLLVSDCMFLVYMVLV